jgi:hypothetical protein
MKFRQLIVVSIISMCAYSVQAAVVTGMTSAQIRTEIAAQQSVAAMNAAVIAVAPQAAVAVEPAPTLVLPLPPLAAPTRQTVCSVSCS